MCEEDESWRYNSSTSNVSIAYVDNCYVEVTNNDSGLLIERRECSHIFVTDNTYSSQVWIIASQFT